MVSPNENKKGDVVALPAQLYIAEGKQSANKVKQERHTPDPDDATFAKLIEDSQKEKDK